MENNKHSCYDLFRMIKENRIRKGDILVLINKEDPTLKDYYITTDKDFKWLLNEADSIYLFDNFYLKNLLTDWDFTVVFKSEEKEKVFMEIRKANLQNNE